MDSRSVTLYLSLTTTSSKLMVFTLPVGCLYSCCFWSLKSLFILLHVCVCFVCCSYWNVPLAYTAGAAVSSSWRSTTAQGAQATKTGRGGILGGDYEAASGSKRGETVAAGGNGGGRVQSSKSTTLKHTCRLTDQLILPWHDMLTSALWPVNET